MSNKIKRICIYLFFIALVVIGAVFYFSRNMVEVPETAVREPRPQPTAEAPTLTPTSEPDVPTPVYEPEPTGEHEPTEEYVPQPRVLLPRIVQLREYYDNPDIVGFIEIPDTNISYPVVQTGNNVFYLYHDIRLRRSVHGAIFLDYENDLYALNDHNTLIYGHNMFDGSKFHNIRHFHNENFFREHTYILLTTPYEETVWDIFSFFRTHIDFCYLTTNFHTDEAFYEFILELQRKSLWTNDIVLDKSDRILILSTCETVRGLTDYRYIVIARLRVESN
ncbi:MAG: class B sortase [Firmicutes bacterium]|nr:class B sortase [Bacillota bacterium]